jgi:hypothetical protein
MEVSETSSSIRDVGPRAGFRKYYGIVKLEAQTKDRANVASLFCTGTSSRALKSLNAISAISVSRKGRYDPSAATMKRSAPRKAHVA